MEAESFMASRWGVGLGGSEDEVSRHFYRHGGKPKRQECNVKPEREWRFLSGARRLEEAEAVPIAKDSKDYAGYTN